MSADLLRRAASLMRERAEAATPGPWKCGPEPTRYVQWEGDVRTAGLADDQADEIAQSLMYSDGAHIASWHPAVALAVAAWLDREADWADIGANNSPEDVALDLARTYLGEES